MMIETVSVEQALKRGRNRVIIPSFLIIGLVISGIILSFFSLPDYMFAFLPLLLIPGLLLAGVYRGVMVTRWRVWAFGNVRNVHELKRRAIQAMLIPRSEKKIFERLEIWSDADKEKWRQLQTKFQRDDVFIDDHQIPQETVIRYSKLKKGFYLVFYLFACCVGLFFLFVPKKERLGLTAILGYLWATGITGLMGYMFYITIGEFKDTSPKLVINNLGIRVNANLFYKWSEISEEKIVHRRAAKSTQTFLVYTTRNGVREMLLDDFNIGWKKLENLLAFYRSRGKAVTGNRL